VPVQWLGTWGGTAMRCSVAPYMAPCIPAGRQAGGVQPVHALSDTDGGRYRAIALALVQPMRARATRHGPFMRIVFDSDHAVAYSSCGHAGTTLPAPNNVRRWQLQSRCRLAIGEAGAGTCPVGQHMEAASQRATWPVRVAVAQCSGVLSPSLSVLRS
jgi:hypothetical protein